MAHKFSRFGMCGECKWLWRAVVIDFERPLWRLGAWSADSESSREAEHEEPRGVAFRNLRLTAIW